MGLTVQLTCSIFLIVVHSLLPHLVYSIHIPFGILLDATFEPDSKTSLMLALSLHNSKRLNEPKLQILYDDYATDNTFEFIKKVCTQMSTGIFLMYGSMSTRTFHACQSYSHTFHLPYITNYSPGDELESIGRFVFIKPNYIKAISELIKVLGWRTFFYIYDSFEGIKRIETVKRNLADDNVDVSLIRIQQVNSAHKELRQADQGNQILETFIVIDVSSTRAFKLILKQIAEVGMNRIGYNYILSTFNMKALDLSQLRHGGATVFGLQLVDFDNVHVKKFQESWRSLEPLIWPGAGTDTITTEVAFSMDVIELIKKALITLLQSRKDIFQFTFRRGNIYNTNLTLGIRCSHHPVQPWMHGNDLHQALKQVSFEGYTGHIQFDNKGRRENYSIDIVSMTTGSYPKKSGTWHSAYGIQLDMGRNSEKLQISEKGDNRTVVATFLQAPFLMLRSSSSNDGVPLIDNNRFEGYTKDLADEISSHLGFQYALDIVEDGDCAIRLENGSWTGLIGRILNRRADLAIGPLAITLEREKVVDFSMSFMKSGISALLHQPARVKANMFFFMEPFSLSLWMSIVLVCLAVGLVLFLVCRVGTDNLETPTSLSGRLSLTNSFWFILSSLLSQGSDIFLRSVAGRIVGGTWWFFVLILLSSYTANLAAFLTIDRMHRPIKTLDDLLNQQEVFYGTMETGFPRDFLESTNIITYKQLWETMTDSYQKVMVKSVEDGLQRVQNSKGKYALIMESSLAEFHANRKPCNTMEIISSFNHKGFGIATQLKSLLTKDINVAILHLKEEGTLRKLKQIWWEEKNECIRKSSVKDRKNHSLELANILGAFLILILGLFIAMCVRLIETIIEKSAEKRLCAYEPQARRKQFVRCFTQLDSDQKDRKKILC